MAITIQGIRVRSITVSRTEDGEDKVNAEYELISSVGKVLARQSLTSKPDYGTTVFVPSPQTMKALAEAVAAYVKDAQIHLGLE
jgi:hypothetical protein